MKYLTKQELLCLTDSELGDYAMTMTVHQQKIVDVMEQWVYAFNDTSDEYDRRKPTSSQVVIKNDSGTKH